MVLLVSALCRSYSVLCDSSYFRELVLGITHVLACIQDFSGATVLVLTECSYSLRKVQVIVNKSEEESAKYFR